MNSEIVYRDKKIHFQVAGSGPAIVLLHGFLESKEVWKNFLRRLSKEFLVVTIDLPGFGESDNLGSIHTMDDFAAVVHLVLKHLEIRSCILAGHSMGGYVTLAYAEKYPKTLRGFVLFHSQAACDSEEARMNRERTIRLVEKDHHGFIKNFIPDLFDQENVKKFSREIGILKDLADKTGKEGIIAALEGMKIRLDRQHVLTNSKVPVLFIIGKNDSRIPMEVVIPQTLLPEHAEILLLDHVGHMGFIEASEKTFQTIRAFAAKF